MTRTLKYSSFIIACMLVVVVFVTAKTYTQLGVAVLLYPLAAYFAYKLFLNNDHKVPLITVQLPAKLAEKIEPETVKPKREQVDVADVDKRTFLKFIGATGISFFLFSILGRRVDNLLFGNTMDPMLIGRGNSAEGQVGTTERLPTDSYLISEIDDGLIAYYGFINKDGAWFIMKEDPDTGSLRYTKGESNFPDNWTNRKDLKYDYFHNIF